VAGHPAATNQGHPAPGRPAVDSCTGSSCRLQTTFRDKESHAGLQSPNTQALAHSVTRTFSISLPLPPSPYPSLAPRPFNRSRTWTCPSARRTRTRPWPSCPWRRPSSTASWPPSSKFFSAARHDLHWARRVLDLPGGASIAITSFMRNLNSSETSSGFGPMWVSSQWGSGLGWVTQGGISLLKDCERFAGTCRVLDQAAGDGSTREHATTSVKHGCQFK
jgi:hypothetical protein